MTFAERDRRLAQITSEQYRDALYYAQQGFSARAVARETGITLKQANACFKVFFG